MEAKKIIIIISIIINILTIGSIYNFIKKEYLNNEKIIVKAMTEVEYEKNITDLNQSLENYMKFIKECKTQIASAITDMGIATSNEATLETMSSNIRSIVRDASYIKYDNSRTTLTSTNVQDAVDELNNSIEEIISGTSGDIHYYKSGNVVQLIMENKQRTFSKGYIATIPFKPFKTFVIHDYNNNVFTVGHNGTIYTDGFTDKWCSFGVTYITND